MSGFNFPIFKTKIKGVAKKFALEDPVQRRKYFELKAGLEIKKMREFLEKGNTFVGFLLGPKNSGKGTYTKLFSEAIGGDYIAHISVGDIVRSVYKVLETEKGKSELLSYLEKRYRGFLSAEEVIKAILGKSQNVHLPTEGILALVEREIDKIGRKAIFIDGFPRNLDQVSYSLYFRALIGYRDDPDFFVFIDVPEAVIDERMKYRVTCPVCQSPRNIKLLRTKEAGYDFKQKEFFLLCDNPQCAGFGKSRMVAKEGDALGIESIRNRLEMESEVIQKLSELKGVPKIFLRNSIPVKSAKKYTDDYEITPAYKYELLKSGKVKIIEELWTVKDEKGEFSYSLLPAPVAVSFIKQVVQVLGL